MLRTKRLQVRCAVGGPADLVRADRPPHRATILWKRIPPAANLPRRASCSRPGATLAKAAAADRDPGIISLNTLFWKIRVTRVQRKMLQVETFRFHRELPKG